GLFRSVEHARQRLGKRGDVERQLVRDAVHHPLGNNAELRGTTVAHRTDVDETVAEVRMAGPAIPARLTPDVRVHDDTRPWLERYFIADVLDCPAEFVADDDALG